MADEPIVYSKNGTAIFFDVIGTIIGIFIVCLYALEGYGLIPALIFTPIGAIYIYLLDKSYKYELREDGVYVYHGIISRTHALFLYEKIQDVNESQSFIHRIFGIKNLRISTMTSGSQTGGMLYGLTEDQATTVRKEILEKVFSATHSGAKSFSTSKNKSGSNEISSKIGKLQGEIEPSLIVVNFYFKLILLSIFATFAVSLAIGWAAVIIFIISLLVFGLQAVKNFIYHKYTYLQYDDEKIFIKTGFLSRITTTIPYNKIQDIQISRGPFDRQIGLASINIQTGEQTRYGGKEASILPQGLINIRAEDALKIYKFAMESIHSEVKNEKLQAEMKKFPFTSNAFFYTSIVPILILLIFGLFYWPAILLCIVMTPIILFFSNSYFKSINYYFTDKNLIMKRGVIVFDTISVPIKNIQDVVVGQGLINRIFGYYYVKVSTISASSMFLTYDYLTQETAQSLAEFLRNQMKKNMTGD
ncbi:PH domain-containing protein [Candidatus Micrarchaeota archaeon]|nr:PH domain-containing protein [Candidatus Micrarchaeota archaeon]